ncbi:unnamed protein product [Calypogeia fissa]
MSHFGRAGPPDIRDTYSLLVLNITFRTSADDLFPLFDRYGKVVDIFIPRDRRTGESRGFAFVRYKYADEAQKAIERLDGKNVDGREIAVQYAKYGPNAEAISSRGRISQGSPRWKGGSRSRSRSPGRSSRGGRNRESSGRDSRPRRYDDRNERDRCRESDRGYHKHHKRRSPSPTPSRSRSRSISRSRSPRARANDADYRRSRSRSPSAKVVSSRMRSASRDRSRSPSRSPRRVRSVSSSPHRSPVRVKESSRKGSPVSKRRRTRTPDSRQVSPGVGGSPDARSTGKASASPRRSTSRSRGSPSPAPRSPSPEPMNQDEVDEHRSESEADGAGSPPKSDPENP